jgi:hypothetical protein
MPNIKTSEALYIKLVKVKHLYIKKQPASLSILEKRDRVKVLSEACNEVLSAPISDYYLLP